MVGHQPHLSCPRQHSKLHIWTFCHSAVSDVSFCPLPAFAVLEFPETHFASNFSKTVFQHDREHILLVAKDWQRSLVTYDLLSRVNGKLFVGVRSGWSSWCTGGTNFVSVYNVFNTVERLWLLIIGHNVLSLDSSNIWKRRNDHWFKMITALCSSECSVNTGRPKMIGARPYY